MGPEGHRVVVTGIGPVTAIGTGRDEFWENLLAGTVNIRPIPPSFESGYKFRSRFYVPFPQTDLEKNGFPSKYGCLMEDSTRAAVIAARLAVEDAGIPWTESGATLPVAPENCMIILGTGICTLRAGFDAFYAHALSGEAPRARELALPERFNRMVIPMIMPDAAASWISILGCIRGGNYTLNASCASGTYAIGEAYLKLRSGETEMALAGGVECLRDPSGTVMRGFDGLGTLTTSEDGLPRPFSLERSGFLFAEGGACILVLETLEGAERRGATPYAEILGYRAGSEACNIVQMDESGQRIFDLLEKLISGRKIDYFNSHGTATRLNDEIETRVFQRLFGSRDQQPLINATKGTTGHSIGNSGAVEAAATVLSISRSVIHPSLAGTPIEDLNLATERKACTIRHAVSASYGFGGHNAALLFGKMHDHD